jgi:hypothetical protein
MIETIAPVMKWARDTFKVFSDRVYHNMAPRGTTPVTLPYLVLVFLPNTGPTYHTGSKRKLAGSVEAGTVLFNVYGADSAAVINIGLAMKVDITKMVLQPESADLLDVALGSQGITQARDRSRKGVLVWHFTQAVELVIDSKLAG